LVNSQAGSLLYGKQLACQKKILVTSWQFTIQVIRKQIACLTKEGKNEKDHFSYTLFQPSDAVVCQSDEPDLAEIRRTFTKHVWKFCPGYRL